MVRRDPEPFRQLRRRQYELYGGVRFMRRRRILIGLLIAGALIGSIDVALRSDYVIATAPQNEKPPFAKFQDRLIAVAEPATARSVSLQTPGQSANLGEAEAFSVENIHPTASFVTQPASSTQQASRASPTLVSSQSGVAAEPHRIPLPRRKPSSAPVLRAKSPITKEAQTTTVKQIPMDQEQGEQMPKPMAFGSIGYNYNPQQ
jgi:hypothetical protein